jgi:hypothetical protein
MTLRTNSRLPDVRDYYYSIELIGQYCNIYNNSGSSFYRRLFFIKNYRFFTVPIERNKYVLFAL